MKKENLRVIPKFDIEMSRAEIISHLYYELVYNNMSNEKDKESFREAIKHILEESERRGKKECGAQ